MKPFIWLICLLFILSQFLFADVIVFPMTISDVDSTNTSTINQLFAEDYANFSKQKVVLASDSIQCASQECAIAQAKALAAEEIIFSSVRKLGAKWIVSSFRIRVSDSKVLSTTRLDCKSVEDFEFVMKRTAEALAKEKSLEDVVSVDNVTEKEMGEEQFRKREGFYALGLKTGYLFPMGSKSYQQFTEAGRINGNYYYDSYDTTQFKQILNTDWINWFELPKELALEWNLHVGWGAEVGTSFSLLKLFSKTDFCPYMGGGLGIDYVFPENWEDKNKRNSGFALNAKAGMLFFRTYSFRLMLDAGYKVVFNDDMDQGINVNLGIMWKKPRASRVVESSSRSPLTNGLAVIGGIVLVSILIGAIAN